jgi:FAD/FMN-containing dehydrogenase
MSDLDMEFYDERLLPLPDHEYRPESAAELREVVEGEAGLEPEHSLVVLGGGEHLRSSAIGERRFDVVRTEECDRVRSVDRESNTIRVEAGVTWGELREVAAAEQRALHRYRLHPEGATIGGLLGRWQPLERQLHRGDLRAGCIATRTASPGGAGYSYLPAPRKASGPDHRFLYIGGEGAFGVVLEATLVLAPRQPGALLEWEAPTGSSGFGPSSASTSGRRGVGGPLRRRFSRRLSTDRPICSKCGSNVSAARRGPRR